MSNAIDSSHVMSRRARMARGLCVAMRNHDFGRDKEREKRTDGSQPKQIMQLDTINGYKIINIKT